MLYLWLNFSLPILLWTALIILVVAAHIYWIRQRRKKMLELRLKRSKEQEEKANQNSEENQGNQ
jgi:cytochrome c-type biogenesis protein CcmH/NrfF